MGNKKPYIKGQNTMTKGQTMIYKTKDWATRTPLKIGVELMFSGREIYGLGYQQYFSYTVSIKVISGRNRSIRWKSPTDRKSL